jgi:hypothetical protein
MDPDYLARVRGHVRLAFAASVYVAFLNSVFCGCLLNCKFSRSDVAHHVIVHYFLRGDCSRLKYDIDDCNALVGGDIGVPHAPLDPMIRTE